MYFCYSTILEYFEVNYNLNFVLPCHDLSLIKAACYCIFYVTDHIPKALNTHVP